MPVTTRIIPFLVGDSEKKPSFTTIIPFLVGDSEKKTFIYHYYSIFSGGFRKKKPSFTTGILGGGHTQGI